jgi:hypothetical protein
MGDLEHRFGVTVTPESRRSRIDGAVEMFLSAYGTTARSADDR